MLDNTPLPILVADYKGFVVTSDTELTQVAHELTGRPNDLQIAARLQARLLELTPSAQQPWNLWEYRVCPRCGSPNLQAGESTDYERDDIYDTIRCEDCGWHEANER